MLVIRDEALVKRIDDLAKLHGQTVEAPIIG